MSLIEKYIKLVEQETKGTLIANTPVIPGRPLTDTQLRAIKMNIDMGNTYPPEIMDMYNKQTGSISATQPFNPPKTTSKSQATQSDVRKVDNQMAANNAPTGGFQIQVPKGNKGTDVADLQKGLEALDPKALPMHGVDGYMGDETANAIRNFQKANSIPETGQADPATVAALNKALQDKGLLSKLTPSTQTDVVAGKVKNAPDAGRPNVKGDQSPKTQDGNQATPAQQTTPADPNSVRPEVQAMADLLKSLAQKASLKENQIQTPAEQIARYQSILEYSEDLKEVAIPPWAIKAGQQLKGVGTVAGGGLQAAKKVLPFAGAGFGLWGLGSEVSNIKSDLDAGDYGSALLGSLAALAHGVSIPLAFASTMAGGAAGIGASVAGNVLGSAAASRREGRSKRELVDAVNDIQSKLQDPKSGFTPAEVKLLSDNLQAVKVQLIRNNIAFE